MAADFVVGPPESQAELDRYAQIFGETFLAPPARCDKYVELIGEEQIRLVRQNGAVAGGLALLPTAQIFGRRAVPMVGIAVVATAPEFRARGAATVLLREMLAELHAQGMAISTLYPATVALYRRVGYELAGASWDFAVPLHRIDIRERGATVRPVTVDDTTAIRDLYAQWAHRSNGQLTRSELFWERVYVSREEKALGWVVEEAGNLTGYVYIATQSVAGTAPVLRVRDMAYTTSTAARQILTFLADHRTNRGDAVWRTGASDPLLHLLAEAPYRVTNFVPWMVRIVDVAAALTARGYPTGLAAELDLEVRDDVLTANEGRWKLQVSDGRAAVEAGGSGALQLDVRTLAALYSGHQNVYDLAATGLIRGSSAALAAAAAIFGGPAPWMRDEF